MSPYAGFRETASKKRTENWRSLVKSVQILRVRNPTFMLSVVLVCMGASACTNPAAVAEPCVDSSDCDSGLTCISQSSAEPANVCMTDCDLDSVRVCADGSVCTPVMDGAPDRPANLGVCYLGGTVPVGDACGRNVQCEQGAVCVLIAEAQSCFTACVVDDGSACAEGEVCTALESMGNRGFCQPES